MDSGRRSHYVRDARRRALQLLNRSGQLWRFNFSVRTDVAGAPFKVPILFGEGRQNIVPIEEWLDETLARLFRLHKGAFLDVGVNVGQTLLKAKALDPARRYYGFEPNPRCCQYVEQLIRANRLAACAVIPAGLSSYSGLAVLQMTKNTDLDSCASVVPGHWPDDSDLDTRYVTVLHGDVAVETIGIAEIAAIKIDVEGGELDVLRGLERTLRAHQPYLVFEILPVVDVASNYGRLRIVRRRALLDLLAMLGYRLYRVHLDATVELIADIEDEYTDLALSNYIAVHENTSESFLDAFPSRAVVRSVA
jgi:FkbM family methyltransferase